MSDEYANNRIVSLRQALEEAEARVEDLESTLQAITDQIRLAEHKVDQHLQGQYNHPPYPCLGVALASLRSALLLLKADPLDKKPSTFDRLATWDI